MNKKPKIVITGASGTVGYEVLKQIIKHRDKYDINVFTTRSKRSLKIMKAYKNDVTIVYGDISNYDDVKKICANVDVVIHLAAIIPPLADDNPELAHKVNVVGTENFVRNIEELSPNAFFLYSSSISVYGDRLENPIIKVNDPLTPSDRDEYALTKIQAENILTSSKLDWSIFRLTAIMGNHKMSKLMFHMPLLTSMEIATPEDTARAFVNAIEKRTSLSKNIYNLSGGESCRTNYQDFLNRSFEIFGLGKPIFPNKVFAEKNFHCGFYEDGDELEKILHFQKDSLDAYFEKEKAKVSSVQKFFTSLLNKQIQKHLYKQSEPYLAFKEQNLTEMKHYFKD